MELVVLPPYTRDDWIRDNYGASKAEAALEGRATSSSPMKIGRAEKARIARSFAEERAYWAYNG